MFSALVMVMRMGFVNLIPLKKCAEVIAFRILCDVLCFGRSQLEHTNVNGHV
jgi:hypothetical protein